MTGRYKSGIADSRDSKGMFVKMEVRIGAHDALPMLMTKEQAKRYGDRNMPKDLKHAGFETVIFTADPEINGWSGYRINYGMRVGRPRGYDGKIL